MIPIIDKKIIRRRNTTQRDLVLDAVSKSNHPSAREIFETVSKQSGMSFGTVYRNLQILVEAGEIIQIQADNSSAHYDRRLHRHYHLHCQNCGGVFDVLLPYQAELDNRAKELSGFSINSHNICFEGTCSQCQNDQSPAASVS